MIDLKSYFHNKYQGGEDFIENVILPIFGEDKYEDAYEEDVLENNPELTSMASAIGISQVLRMGTINIPMNPTDVFDITVSNHVQMERNRVAIQSLVRRIMSTYSSAFMVFHYDDDTRWDWRFTFCSKKGNNQESTDSKRYTFLLGPNQSCRTAAENFKKLADKRGDIELEDIVKAFDVESLSKEFFEKYKVRYGRFVGHIIGKEYIDRGDGKGEWREKEGRTPSELFYGLHEDEKRVRDYIKKLLGRIVFLHFLQKKGWLGATDEEWTNGPQDFMLRLYDKASADQKANFLDEILEPLFSCLDTPLNERREVFDTKVDGLRSVRVPFLGGLFERTEEDKALSLFPADLFADLFKFLSEYNFTIDENDPNDAQVGVDPEMLGRIFENLLEDNKDKGAFYTPKEIVQYMCRESLIAYLQTDVTDEATREALRQFVTTHDVNVLGGKESALALNVSQCLKDVKICDPAIGSGAFPMGLLNELFLCRGVIEDFANAAAIKRHIIQQNIYGVDIEKGAVEIARLRFWLSLITDADTPEVLPNMDFKIMQGNSLLEQYKGFDLSHIMDTKMEIHAGHQYQMFEERIDVIRAEVKRAIQDYYSEQSHDMRRTMRDGIQQQIQQQIRTQGYNVDISDIKDIAATDQFFLWHTWFSEVFEEGGFDIVIGNPPYGVSIKGDYRNTVVNSLGKVPDFEIYYYFIELSKKLLKGKGIISYIIPNTWLFNTFAKSFRENIFSTWKVEEVLDCSKFKIFETATVMNTVLRFIKQNKNNNIVGYRNTLNANSFEELINEPIVTLPKKDVLAMNQNWGLVFRLNTSSVALVNKITSKGKRLEEYFPEISQGLIAYDKYKGQSAEIIKNRAYHYATYHEGLKPMLWGEDVTRYSVNWNGKEWIDYCDGIANPRKPKYFRERRLLVREITNPSIFAAITEDELYNDPAVIIALDSVNYSIEVALAILNSKVATYYHFNHSPKATKGSFPKILVQDVKDFPLPQIKKDEEKLITDYVNNIIFAKQQDCKADTSALEHEIDLLVYDLYGLTPEEIAIVEGTNNA